MARTLLGEALDPEQRRQRAIQIAHSIENAVNSRTEATVAAVQGDLERLRIEIVTLLAQQPPSWQVTQLNALLAEVKAAVDRWKMGASERVGANTLSNADDGASIPGAIAIGVGNEDVGMIASEYAQPSIDDTVVAVAYASSAYMVEDVGGMLQTQVDSLVRRMALAGMTPYDAIQALTPSATVRRGMPFASAAQRAETIIRTEMGRVFSQATDAAMQDAAGYLPNMQQQWLATEDDRTRLSHREANEQIVDMGQPFEVGSALLRFPRDPEGPPEETINCRCVVVPWVDEWAVEAPVDMVDQVPMDGEAFPVVEPLSGDVAASIPLAYEIADIAARVQAQSMQGVKDSILKLSDALRGIRIQAKSKNHEQIPDALDQLGRPVAGVEQDKKDSSGYGMLRIALESDGTAESRRVLAERWLSDALDAAKKVGNEFVRPLDIVRQQSATLEAASEAAQRHAVRAVYSLFKSVSTDEEKGTYTASVIKFGARQADGTYVWGLSAEEAAKFPEVLAQETTYAAFTDGVPKLVAEDNARRSKIIADLAEKAGVNPYGGTPIGRGFSGVVFGSEWLRFLSTLPDEALIPLTFAGEKTAPNSQTLNLDASTGKATLIPLFSGFAGDVPEFLTADQWRERMRTLADGMDATTTLRRESSAIAHIAWANQAANGIIAGSQAQAESLTMDGVQVFSPKQQVVGGVVRQPADVETATRLERYLHTVERAILADGRLIPSRWSGKAGTGLGGALGQHGWDGKISVADNIESTISLGDPSLARGSLKTLVHEIIHGASTGALDQEFQGALGPEEGITEWKTQIIGVPVVTQALAPLVKTDAPTTEPLAQAISVIPGGMDARGVPKAASKAFLAQFLKGFGKALTIDDVPPEKSGDIIPRGLTIPQWMVIAKEDAESFGRWLEDILKSGKPTGDRIDWGNYESVGSAAPTYGRAWKTWLGEIFGGRETWYQGEWSEDAAKFGDDVYSRLRDLATILNGDDLAVKGSTSLDKYRTGKEFEFWYRQAIDHGVRASVSVEANSPLASRLPQPMVPTAERPSVRVGTPEYYTQVIDRHLASTDLPDTVTEKEVATSELSKIVDEEAKAIRYHLLSRATTELAVDGAISARTTLAYVLLDKGQIGALLSVNGKESAPKVSNGWGWDRSVGSENPLRWAEADAQALLEKADEQIAVSGGEKEAAEKLDTSGRFIARSLLQDAWSSLALPMITTIGTETNQGLTAIKGLAVIRDRRDMKLALEKLVQHKGGADWDVISNGFAASGKLAPTRQHIETLLLLANGIGGIPQRDAQKMISLAVDAKGAKRVVDSPVGIGFTTYAYHRAMLLQVWAMGVKQGVITQTFPEWISEDAGATYTDRLNQIQTITNRAERDGEGFGRTKAAQQKKQPGKPEADIDSIVATVAQDKPWYAESIIDETAHAKYQEIMKPLIDIRYRALKAGIDPAIVAFHAPQSLGSSAPSSTARASVDDPQSVAVDDKGRPVLPVAKKDKSSIDGMDMFWWRDQDLSSVRTWKDVITGDKMTTLRSQTVLGRQWQMGGNLRWLPLGKAQDLMGMRNATGEWLIGPWDFLVYNEQTWSDPRIAQEVERRRKILEDLLMQREGSAK